ncbi:hypothetical protein OG252_21075 [Streptomyces sp. NBC_01352]|uniref:hypothetical protein n=1 Tax=unclassified Streptomyces TaxID=2593676 RepID=UPI002E35ADBA|nr:hypothetical protein [Streptomyces sp. NBC_01352]
MPFRRSAAMAAAAASLMVITMTACGSQKGGAADEAGSAQSGSPTPSYPPPPTCAQPAGTPTALPSSPVPSTSSPDGGLPDGPADAPPNYADNHAYRMQASLSAEQQASGQASAELILTELAKVRKEGGSGEFGRFSDQRVEAALRRVGCGEEHGVSVGNGYYAVYTGVVCVSGRVTKDELTGEVHGVYAEPQPGAGPCVENQGGH